MIIWNLESPQLWLNKLFCLNYKNRDHSLVFFSAPPRLLFLKSLLVYIWMDLRRIFQSIPKENQTPCTDNCQLAFGSRPKLSQYEDTVSFHCTPKGHKEKLYISIVLGIILTFPGFRGSPRQKTKPLCSTARQYDLLSRRDSDFAIWLMSGRHTLVSLG